MSMLSDPYLYTQPVSAAEIMRLKDIREVYTSTDNGGKIKFLGVLLKLIQMAKDELQICETIEDKMCWIDDIGFLERLQFKIERDLAAYKYRNDYFMREVDVNQRELDEAQSLRNYIMRNSKGRWVKKEKAFREKFNKSKQERMWLATKFYSANGNLSATLRALDYLPSSERTPTSEIISYLPIRYSFTIMEIFKDKDLVPPKRHYKAIADQKYMSYILRNTKYRSKYKAGDFVMTTIMCEPADLVFRNCLVVGENLKKSPLPLPSGRWLTILPIGMTKTYDVIEEHVKKR